MKISEDTYRCALQHIVKDGDTDLFPHPFELKFLRDCEAELCRALSGIDVTQYHPMSVVQSLVPKSKYGFRTAHQPFPIDTLVFTALVLQISDEVESGRDAIANRRAFSYRKVPGLADEFFVGERTYKQWLQVLEAYVFSEDFTHVIRTDISDFYQRIYRHRLENILLSLSSNSVAVTTIERLLNEWRGGQSFGIPIGTDAARLLAEAALNDTDLALTAEGIDFTRYVDDIAMFVRKGQDPYAVLAFLAGHLASNEGLSLNNQKTLVLNWDEYLQSLGDPGAEDDASKEEFATEKLFWAAYGQEDADPKALEALMMKDLRKELEELLSEAHWEMGKIRVVLHAMRLVRNSDVALYIRKNIGLLLPFAKDVCLLIEEFVTNGVTGFEGLSGELVELLLSPSARPLECARAWFLELGVRNVVQFSQPDIRRLSTLPGTLDLRQLHLLRWRAGEVNYFRALKVRVSEVPPWVQPAFIFSARCLPKDEYSHWIRGIKSRLQFPLAKEFADWCLRTYDRPF